MSIKWNDRPTLLDGEIFVDRSLWLSSVLESDIRKTPHRSGFTLNSSFKFLQDEGNCARYAILFLVYLNTKDGLRCDSLSNELMIIIILITRPNKIKTNKIIFWNQFIYGDWRADFLAPSGALKIGPSRYPTNPIHPHIALSVQYLRYYTDIIGQYQQKSSPVW